MRHRMARSGRSAAAEDTRHQQPADFSNFRPPPSLSSIQAAGKQCSRRPRSLPACENLTLAAARAGPPVTREIDSDSARRALGLCDRVTIPPAPPPQGVETGGWWRRGGSQDLSAAAVTPDHPHAPPAAESRPSRLGHLTAVNISESRRVSKALRAGPGRYGSGEGGGAL